MSNPRAEEWDWPPNNRQPPRPVEGRIRAERIILPRARRHSRGRVIARKTRDGFTNGVFGLARLAFALFLGGILFAAIVILGAAIHA